MVESVVKRDGTVVPFDMQRIINAIAAAGAETEQFGIRRARQLAIRAVERLERVFPASDPPHVEDIQDYVEDTLLDSTFKATARAYILYRDKKRQAREFASIELVDEYLGHEDWRVRENANMAFSLQGLNNHIAGTVSAKYWLDRIYTPEISNLHRTGAFHIHDLSTISGYCAGWDLMDILCTGFRGVRGKVAAGPPKHFSTVLGQIFNFLFSLQGELAGAQAIANFDTLLAPFVRYDKLTYEGVIGSLKQEMQQFMFNMNTSTRVGFSVPFTNLTMDLTPHATLKDVPVIIGGEKWINPETKEPYVYAEFQEEMDLINQAFCEIMYEGDFEARTFTFPIPTYNITEDFDWDNPKLEMLWRMTGKYGIPYFANYIGSDMNPEDARSMCCRLMLDIRELHARNGGMFGSAPLTGSIGVVTLNLPQLGYKHRTDFEAFKEGLRDLMNAAAESLQLKRKYVEKLTEQGLYPYSRFFLRSVKEQTGQYWRNHFGTVGIIGMNECLLNMFGYSIEDPEGREKALEIQEFMREHLLELQQRYGAIFNLEATPAEGTSYRLAKIDKSVNSRCATAADICGGDTPYYTNSTHLPVSSTPDLFKALEHQEPLQKNYTGGTVLHGFIGSEITDPEQVKNIIRKVCTNYAIPYFSLTPTFSICKNDGYLAGEQHTCPTCGEEAEVFTRIVGYYRPVKFWNKGKQAEYSDRVEYESVGDDG